MDINRQMQVKLQKKPALIVDHFQAFSTRVGVKYAPDDWWVSVSAGAASKESLNNNALELFKLNVQHYPEFAGAWLELGNYYWGIQKSNEARVAFSRALELDPDNSRIKTQLEALSND